MKINNKYNHFDEVYLVADSDQNLRLVIEIKILPTNLLIYILSCNGEFSEHYEDELSKEKSVI